MTAANVTNNHDGPLGIGTNIIHPGRTERVENWEMVKLGAAIKAWLSQRIISASEVSDDLFINDTPAAPVPVAPEPQLPSMPAAPETPASGQTAPTSTLPGMPSTADDTTPAPSLPSMPAAPETPAPSMPAAPLAAPMPGLPSAPSDTDAETAEKDRLIAELKTFGVEKTRRNSVATLNEALQEAKDAKN